MRDVSRAFKCVPIATPLDQRRRFERRRCSLRVGLVTRHGTFHVRLDDISAGGIGFTVLGLIKLKPGERLILSHDRWGEVPCVVRWAVYPRYGAAFEAGGKIPAGVKSFYDTLGPSPDEIA